MGTCRLFAGKHGQARTVTIVAFACFRQLAAAENGTDPGGEVDITLPAVEVVATPLPGGSIDRDKVPASVETLTAEDFARNPIASVTDTLFQGIPGVSLSDRTATASHRNSPIAALPPRRSKERRRVSPST